MFFGGVTVAAVVLHLLLWLLRRKSRCHRDSPEHKQCYTANLIVQKSTPTESSYHVATR
jgi:hypothetical protein